MENETLRDGQLRLYRHVGRTGNVAVPGHGQAGPVL